MNKTENVNKFKISQTLPFGMPGSTFPFDVVAEIWWKDSAFAFLLPMHFDRMVDSTVSYRIDSIELEVMQPTGTYRVIQGLHKCEEMSTKEFSQHWSIVHRKRILSQPLLMKLFKGYIQNHSLPQTATFLNGKPVDKRTLFDGIVQTNFNSIFHIFRVIFSSQYRKNIVPDEAKFFVRKQAKEGLVKAIV